MNDAERPPDIADLQFQLARLNELKEQLLDAMEMVAQLPNSAKAEAHLASIYGSLTFICTDLTALLERLSVMGGA